MMEKWGRISCLDTVPRVVTDKIQPYKIYLLKLKVINYFY